MADLAHDNGLTKPAASLLSSQPSHPLCTSHPSSSGYYHQYSQHVEIMRDNTASSAVSVATPCNGSTTVSSGLRGVSPTLKNQLINKDLLPRYGSMPSAEVLTFRYVDRSNERDEAAEGGRPGNDVGSVISARPARIRSQESQLQQTAQFLKEANLLQVTRAQPLQAVCTTDNSNDSKVIIDARAVVGEIQVLVRRRDWPAAIERIGYISSAIYSALETKKLVYLTYYTARTTEIERKGLQGLFSFLRSCSCERIPRLRSFQSLLLDYSVKGKTSSILCLLADFQVLFSEGTGARIKSVLGCGGENIVFELRLNGMRFALRRAGSKTEVECISQMRGRLDREGFALFTLHSKRKYVLMPIMENFESYFRNYMGNGGDGLVLVDVIEDVSSQLLSMKSLGLVHCDVKPQNIMVRQDSTDQSPYFLITDYGSSKKRGERGTKLGGTVPYRDPFALVYAAENEQDYWSLGMSMFLLINKITEGTNRSRSYRRIQEWNREMATRWICGERFRVPVSTEEWCQDFTDIFYSKLNSNKHFYLPNSDFLADTRKFVAHVCDWNYSTRWQPSRMLLWCKRMRRKYQYYRSSEE